jgi:hypothetical protein
MSEGFLGRWARRKEAVREGKVVEDAPPPSPQPSPASGRGGLESPSPQRGEGGGEGATDRPPLPTLADTESLTPASDFTRFVAPDVPPDVKNAALKKLFADPHFNVMDRLDTYIDDYGQPDPLPAAWARQLASARFLKLFDEKEAPAAPRDDADAAAPAAVAQSDLCKEVPDADADLRLQQDDAAGPGEPGPGTR